MSCLRPGQALSSEALPQLRPGRVLGLDSNHQAGYSGDELTFGLLWLAFLPASLASQNESFSSCMWGGNGEVATV